MLEKETEKKIFGFIANAKEPIHSTDIANALGINRVTVAKYLSVLHSKGMVNFKSMGMAKAWFPVESPLLHALNVNDEHDTTLHALNSLHDGVCVLDREMRIVWLNNVMEKRHGKLSKLKGRNCFDVFHEEEEICGNCPSKRAFETGKNDRALIKGKGGTIEISTSPIKDPKGKTVAVIEIVRVVK